MATPPAAESRPLALAAGASAGGGDIIDIGDWPPNELPNETETAGVEDRESHLLSESMPLGNEFQT